VCVRVCVYVRACVRVLAWCARLFMYINDIATKDPVIWKLPVEKYDFYPQ